MGILDVPAYSRGQADRLFTATRPSTVVSMLQRDYQDINLALLGDSTGNESGEWFRLMLVRLAGQFPKYTIVYRLWNHGAQAYDAPETLQVGTGTHTLYVYNGSVPGENVTYAADGLVTRINAMLPVQMHALIFSYGYNFPSLTSYREYAGYNINQLLNFQPRAEVFLCSQPPLASTNTADQPVNHVLRMDSLRALAEQEGWTIIDATQAFLDYAATHGGSYDNLIQPDLKHPTTGPGDTGSQVWADEASRVLSAQPITNQRPPRGAPDNHRWLAAADLNIVTGTPSFGWNADVEMHTWAFDPGTLEEVAGSIVIPPSWAKTIWRIYWHNPGNTGNCWWTLRTGRLASWMGTNQGGQSNLSAIGNLAASGTGSIPVRVQQMYSGRDAAAIFGGRGVDNGFPAKVKISRDGANAGDTSPADCHLLGVLIERVP
ncbi:SGNH/GDSL hydrolase family protein [Gordonia terrae]